MTGSDRRDWGTRGMGKLTSSKLEVGEATKNLSTVGEKRASVERGAGLKCNRCGPPSVAASCWKSATHTHTHNTLTYTCSAEERDANKSVSPITPTTSTPKDSETTSASTLDRLSVWAALKSLWQSVLARSVCETHPKRATRTRTYTILHTHTHTQVRSCTHTETSNVARVLLFEVVPTDRRRRRGSQMRNKHVRVRSL